MTPVLMLHSSCGVEKSLFNNPSNLIASKNIKYACQLLHIAFSSYPLASFLPYPLDISSFLNRLRVMSIVSRPYIGLAAAQHDFHVALAGFAVRVNFPARVFVNFHQFPLDIRLCAHRTIDGNVQCGLLQQISIFLN